MFFIANIVVIFLNAIVYPCEGKYQMADILGIIRAQQDLIDIFDDKLGVKHIFEDYLLFLHLILLSRVLFFELLLLCLFCTVWVSLGCQFIENFFIILRFLLLGQVFVDVESVD